MGKIMGLSIACCLTLVLRGSVRSDEQSDLKGLIDKGIKAAGSEEKRPFALRVTQLYRREEGEWKIIHRHADPMTQPTEPAWLKQEQR